VDFRTDVVVAVALLGGGMFTSRGAKGRRVLAALAVAGLAAAGCSSPTTAPTTPSPTTAQSAGNLPRPEHVVVVVMENHGLDQILGTSNAPYINQLARTGALFTNASAIAHPSQPNYLALFSGDTHGVTNDSCPHSFSAPNLGRQLLDAHLSFTGYSENLPGVGYAGCEAGDYARKHNPWVNFTNVPGAANQPFTTFGPDYATLPTVSIVVPNLCNDMHDCGVHTGDTWIKNKLDGFVQWAQTQLRPGPHLGRSGRRLAEQPDPAHFRRTHDQSRPIGRAGEPLPRPPHTRRHLPPGANRSVRHYRGDNGRLGTVRTIAWVFAEPIQPQRDVARWRPRTACLALNTLQG
jgi:acid phosphatase